MGYGNAAGCTIFLTSFLGVMLFRRCVGDTSLILIGMVSFASGIYFMSFVTATYMFYLGETERHKDSFTESFLLTFELILTPPPAQSKILHYCHLLAVFFSTCKHL